MSTLFIDEIKRYYYDHGDILSKEKRFHFASRLAAWNGDPKARRILEEMSHFLLSQDDPASRTEMLHTILTRQQTGRRNAHELRAPFFARYPDLYRLQLALFRVRHLKYIYGVDLTDDLLALYPKEKFVQLKKSLLSDPEAMRYLSTFAVNFCYLVDIIILKRQPSFSVEALYDLGDLYDTSNADEIQLLLYFYTHCIICETNFYVQPIPTSRLEIYRKMLTRAEVLIEENLEHITLDNKLEFLVAARICHVDVSLLQKTIYDECADSISPDGMFVIDVHNSKLRPERRTFDKSEHRNTLLIMSDSAFEPSDAVIESSL